MPIVSGELSLWLALTTMSVIAGSSCLARVTARSMYVLKSPWATTETTTTVLAPARMAKARAVIGSCTSAAGSGSPISAPEYQMRSWRPLPLASQYGSPSS